MVHLLHDRGLLKDQVVFIVHGFLNDITTAWMSQMADALLSVEDYTIFLVGWRKGADIPLNYPQAAANTATVASAIAAAVDNVKSK